MKSTCFISILACFLIFSTIPVLLVPVRVAPYQDSDIDVSTSEGTLYSDVVMDSYDEESDMEAFKESVKMAFQAVENTEYVSSILYMMSFIHSQKHRLYQSERSFIQVCNDLEHIIRQTNPFKASSAQQACNMILHRLVEICKSSHATLASQNNSGSVLFIAVEEYYKSKRHQLSNDLFDLISPLSGYIRGIRYSDLDEDERLEPGSTPTEKKLLSVLEELQAIPRRAIPTVPSGFHEPICNYFYSSRRMGNSQPERTLINGLARWTQQQFPTLSNNPHVLQLLQCHLPGSLIDLSVDQLATAIFIDTHITNLGTGVTHDTRHPPALGR
jgi:hypothetical protein